MNFVLNSSHLIHSPEQIHCQSPSWWNLVTCHWWLHIRSLSCTVHGYELWRHTPQTLRTLRYSHLRNASPTMPTDCSAQPELAVQFLENLLLHPSYHKICGCRMYHLALPDSTHELIHNDINTQHLISEQGNANVALTSCSPSTVQYMLLEPEEGQPKSRTVDPFHGHVWLPIKPGLSTGNDLRQLIDHGADQVRIENSLWIKSSRDQDFPERSNGWILFGSSIITVLVSCSSTLVRCFTAECRNVAHYRTKYTSRVAAPVPSDSVLSTQYLHLPFCVPGGKEPLSWE